MAGIVPVVPLARLAPRSHSARLADYHPVPRNGAEKPCLQHGWGSVSVLSGGGGHRVERIEVKAGESMPAHYHRHRSEHWTVVSGEAEVMLGDDVLIASPDDSLYIPAGVVHGLKAGRDSDVALVAVHFGDIVSDDDDLIFAG
jgi:mannose-6-phosphate isomerase-like protein (cupin superfamily)